MKKKIQILLIDFTFLLMCNFLVNAQSLPLATISVNPNNSAWGRTMPNGTFNQPVTTQCSMSAEAFTGYRFVNWVKNGVVVGTSTNLTINVDNTSINIIANFVALDSYLLNITTNGSGTVTPPNGSSFYQGTSVTVTATPSPGYSFVGWTGSITSNSNPINITMDANKTLTATFEPTSTTLWTKSGTSIYYSGNIGINTIGPISNLSLGSGSFNRIAVFENTTNNPGYGFVGLAGLACPYSSYGCGLGLYGGGSTYPTKTNMHVFIGPDGKVGIGNNNPQQLLDVTGAIRTNNMLINDAINTAQIRLNSSGTYYGKIGNPTAQVWSLGYGTGNSDINPILNWTATGNVGIGCLNPAVKLAVNGKIQALEVEVKNPPCSDYVFEKDYKLMNLSDLENFIKSKKHLPDIPSAYEFKEKVSYNLGEMDNLLLRKVEELTLYIIEQNKRIETLEKENIELKKVLK